MSNFHALALISSNFFNSADSNLGVTLDFVFRAGEIKFNLGKYNVFFSFRISKFVLGLQKNLTNKVAVFQVSE